MEHFRLESLKKKDLIDLLTNRGLHLEKKLDKINWKNESKDMPVAVLDNKSAQIAELTNQLKEFKARLDTTEKKLNENTVKVISNESNNVDLLNQMEPNENKPIQNLFQQPILKNEDSNAVILKKDVTITNQSNFFFQIGASAQFFCETSEVLFNKKVGTK